MNILAIETSCDETSAAVVRDGREILSNVVRSQVELHRPYGGVIPELASRNHLQTINALVTQAIEESCISWTAVDAVAATHGPGLAPALLIGLNAAKGIALALRRPFLGINHVEAHLYAPLLMSHREDLWPMVALIVSGGHTILAVATGIGEHRILGQTLDDAAGEAFDKVAKLLGLGYPGGLEIEREARQGNPCAVAFPRGLLREDGYAFSFSGLKTSVLYFVRKNPGVDRRDICASFQEAVVDVLVSKTMRAAGEHGAQSVSVSGGVSINGRLRERLGAECRQVHLPLLLCPTPLCTDNAAMIGALAFHKLKAGQISHFSLDVAPSIGLGVAA